MLQPLDKKQIEEIAIVCRNRRQAELADEGIDSAVDCHGTLVTIGTRSEDTYHSYKEFVVAQIAKMGFKAYEEKAGWFEAELITSLAEDDQDADIWKDDVYEFFNLMEGKK